MDKAFVKAFTKECYSYVVEYETEAERVRKRALARATWDNALSKLMIAGAHILGVSVVLANIASVLIMLLICGVLARFFYLPLCHASDDSGSITSVIVTILRPLRVVFPDAVALKLE